MDEPNLFDAIPLKKSYDFSKKKVIKKLLKKLWTGEYSCTNELGEDVLILRKTSFHKMGKVREIRGKGMDVWTFQGNGYLHFTCYDEKGYETYAEYRGRYD